jgi:hypothetical protein
MKKYKFEVIINEGSDEFWESISNKSGCDEVFDLIKDCLEDKGFNINDDCFIKLINYENI